MVRRKRLEKLHSALQGRSILSIDVIKSLQAAFLPLLAKGHNSMVRRNYWFDFLNGLLWFAVVGSFFFALFCLWQLFSPALWSDWSPLAIGVKVLIVLAGIALPLRAMGELKNSPLKEMAHLERSRMNWQDSPVLELHTRRDDENVTLPLVLTKRISAKAYFFGILISFLVLGIIFIIANILTEITSSTGAAVWLDLPGLLIFLMMIMGIVGIALFQRIEVTEQALFVRRGIVRHKMMWEQAVLFALISQNGSYELSSNRKIVRWSQKPGVLITHPREKQAYQHLMESMLVYIQSRTNLPLRDLR
jgi:hypothetical protein